MALYDGLAGYWSWDEGSGAETADLSYRHRVGTLIDGGFDAGKVGSFGFRPASAAGATVVDGAGFDINDQAPTFSCALWVNLDKPFSSMWGALHALITKWSPGARGFGLFADGSGNVVGRVYDLASSAYDTTYAEAATSGWVHYAVTYGGDGGYIRLYRNGVQVAQTFTSGTMFRSSSDDIVIGEGVEGIIDEAAIWTRELSAAEVLSLYTDGRILWPDTRFPVYNINAYTTQPVVYDVTALFSPPDQAAHPLFVVMMSSAISGVAPWLAQYTTGAAGLVSPPFDFLDPAPTITGVAVSSSHIGTLAGAFGPTDAGWTSYWWEVELPDGTSFIHIGERHRVDVAAGRLTVSDTVTVPPDTSWVGCRMRLVVQSERNLKLDWHAADPAGQDFVIQWASAWVTLTDGNWSTIASTDIVWSGPYTVQNLLNDIIQTYLVHEGQQIPYILQPMGRVQIEQANISQHLRQLERWHRVEVYGGNRRIPL